MKGKQKLKKGKPIRGEARTEHGETKSNVNLSLTLTARDNLDAAATALGISRSELVERLGRKGVAWLVEAGRGDVEKVEEISAPTDKPVCPICGEPAKKKYCSIRCSNTAQAAKSRKVRSGKG